MAKPSPIDLPKRDPEKELSARLERAPAAHAEALLGVVQAGFVEPNPAVFKGVLHAQGRIASAALRLPMTAAAAASVEACLAAIARAT